MSSKLQNQGILGSFYLWEQNSLKVSQVEVLTASLWYFLFSQIILSNCSQKHHEQPCKFQLRVCGYFDGEYRKICPWQVIDQKLRRCHHKQNKGSVMEPINFVVDMSTMKHPNNWTIFKLQLHKSFKKCPSFIERKQFHYSRKST